MLFRSPFTDVPELGTLSFAVTDNDERLACEQALRMAELFWEHHEKMQVPLISLEEMQRQLLSLDGAVEEGLPKSRIGSNSKGTIALVDAADATSSGASGDSNAILRSLMDCGYAGRCLLPIVDRPEIGRAHV